MSISTAKDNFDPRDGVIETSSSDKCNRILTIKMNSSGYQSATVKQHDLTDFVNDVKAASKNELETSVVKVRKVNGSVQVAGPEMKRWF